MSNETVQLRQLLAHHGADVSQWPLAIQPLGFRALKKPELAALIEQERAFEEVMLKRHIPLPSADFTQRIIAAALTRTPLPEAAGWVRDLLSQVRPAALAAMLLLGFAIGFNVMTPPTSTRQTAAASNVSDDEGALL